MAVTPDRAVPVAIESVNKLELERRLSEPSDVARFFLVDAILDADAAARLEDSGVGYVDSAGRRWLPGQERTRRSLQTRAVATTGLRAASIRLAQLLADHPEEEWTERRLAARAETTQPTAHRLLKRLEVGEGLVERRGSGRRSRRRVCDVAGLRRWLAREGRPGRVVKLACFVPEARLATFGPDGPRLALTGALAAERLGYPVMTGGVRPTFRVETGAEELEAVPEAMGGFRTTRGANLTLIADPHRLAFIDPSRLRDGTPVASPSRVMLDLHLESRGQAAVEVFVDLWGSRGVES